MDHKCSKEVEISQIMLKLGELQLIIKGNGKKEGLETTIVRLEANCNTQNERLSTLNENIEAFRTAVSGFEKFQTKIETIIREDEKHRINRQWFIGSIIALIGIVVTLFEILIYNVVT
jgi:hypothetical protein